MGRSPFFRNITALGAVTVAYASWQRAMCIFLMLGMVLVVSAACTSPREEPESAATGSTTTELPQEPGTDQGGLDSGTDATDSKPGTDGGTSAVGDDVPPSADVPEEVQTEILAAIATDLNQDITAITIESIDPEIWPNGCLGLNREGEFCTMALVDGWRVQVSTGDMAVTYRANQDGTLVRREL
ncbi:MAG: hypothetical protein VKJ64_03450 [Leptolyngbyaceae bacterium]|nr:hypothetical protein [Leptolyngbyaceae bacterium]